MSVGAFLFISAAMLVIPLILIHSFWREMFLLIKWLAGISILVGCSYIGYLVFTTYPIGIIAVMATISTGIYFSRNIDIT